MENTANTMLKKYQNLIFPVVAVLIGLLILGLVIIPQGLKIPETNKQIEASRKDLATLNQKISQLNGVDIKQYKDDLNASLTSLPADKDVPGLIVLVVNLLKNNGLTLSGLSFAGQDTAVSGAQIFLVKIDVIGAKENMSNLIDQLKQSPRILKVETLSASTSGANTTMEILIGLDAYYQPLSGSQNLDVSKPVQLPTQANMDTLQRIKNFQAQNAALSTASNSASEPLGKPDPFQ